LENHSQKPQALPIVQGYLGVAYARVGSWERGLDAARQGLDRAQAKDTQQTIAFARMQLAFVHAEGRDWKSCWQILESIPDPATGNGDLTPLGFMILSLKGRALTHLDRAAEGIRIIRSALAWSDQVEYRIFHYLPRFFLAECLLKVGDTGAAGLEAQTALNQAQTTGDRWAAAILMRLLAEISIRRPYPQWEQAEDYLVEARDILRQVRARPDLARTYLALRKLYDRAGRIAWAVDCHFRAVTIFDELGMRQEIRQARGKAAGERRGAVVIPNLQLKGPNN
jgi:tetratricopeptide (TPR) repeat protein